MNRISTRRLLGASGMALLVGMVACSGESLLGGIQGSGNVKTQTREATGFDTIVMAGIGQLTITQGDADSLTVRSDDNILPLLTSSVSGRILTLDTKPNHSIHPTQLLYAIMVKTLKRIDVSGQGDVTATGIAAESLETTVSGSGHVTLSGRTDSQSVHINGSATYDSSGLQSRTATVSISGKGNVVLRTSDTLDVQIDGQGTIRYFGSPKVSQSITGDGSVQRAS
jgi:hypothetical protein